MFIIFITKETAFIYNLHILHHQCHQLIITTTQVTKNNKLTMMIVIMSMAIHNNQIKPSNTTAKYT
jgi:hypothetical protein